MGGFHHPGERRSVASRLRRGNLAGPASILTTSPSDPDMEETSASLLWRLSHQPDPQSWKRFFDLYSPWIYAWLRRRHFLAHHDAEDLVQDVLGTVAREMPGFAYDPHKGKFRSWLRTITVNRLRALRKKGRRLHPAADGMLDQLADPHSGLSHLWDREYERHVASRLLELIEPEFEPITWQAFRRYVQDEAPVDVVAAELGLTRNAVYIAKSRVLRRLRQELQGLID
jgi:RNA polymerase sigma-70 factor (ECF subfamily)